MNKKTYEQKIVPIIVFLTMEAMLLLSFNFGNFPLLFKILAFLFVIVLFPHFKKQFDIDLSHGLFALFAPLMLFAMTTVLSSAYGFSPDGVYWAQDLFMMRNVLTLSGNAIGVLSILLLGYFIRQSKLISAHYVIGIVFAGLGMLLFVSLIATLANYGFFHRIIYDGQVNYYGGHPYEISNQVSFLQGFEIVTVDVKVLSNLALFVLSSSVAFVFIKNIKKDFKSLWPLVSLATLAFLTLILIGDLFTLVFLIPALVIALIIKFKLNNKKYFNNIMIGFGALIGLGLFVFILNAFNVFNIQQLWASNPLTRKLMLNGIIMKFYGITHTVFTNFTLLGISSRSNYFPSGNIIFDSLWLDGIFGGIALVIFLLFVGHNAVKYYKFGEDHHVVKIAIIALLITMGARFMFSYPFHQYIYVEEYWMVNYFPLIESPYFLITAFLAGYMHTRKKVEELVNEK